MQIDNEKKKMTRKITAMSATRRRLNQYNTNKAENSNNDSDKIMPLRSPAV